MNKEYITDYKARLEKGLAEFMELPITGFGGGLLFFVAMLWFANTRTAGGLPHFT